MLHCSKASNQLQTVTKNWNSKHEQYKTGKATKNQFSGASIKKFHIPQTHFTILWQSLVKTHQYWNPCMHSLGLVELIIILHFTLFFILFFHYRMYRIFMSMSWNSPIYSYKVSAYRQIHSHQLRSFLLSPPYRNLCIYL